MPTYLSADRWPLETTTQPLYSFVWIWDDIVAIKASFQLFCAQLVQGGVNMCQTYLHLQVMKKYLLAYQIMVRHT